MLARGTTKIKTLLSTSDYSVGTKREVEKESTGERERERRSKQGDTT